MKKRWISLLMVICLVFTLLPAFAFADRPDFEANADGYHSLGTKDWTGPMVQGWTAAEGQHPYGTTLYFKDGDTYRPVRYEEDTTWFNKSNQSVKTNDDTAGGTSHGWAKPNDDNDGNDMYGLTLNGYYYIDDNGYHQLYYNAHFGGHSTFSNDWPYNYEVFFATSGVSVEISNAQAYAAAVNNGTVKKVSQMGGIQSSSDTWYISRTCRSVGSESNATIQGLWSDKRNADGKMALYYLDDSNNKVYVARNLLSSSQPSWNQELYYMVDPAYVIDPETVPVVDPDDNTGGTVTLDDGSVIVNPQRKNKDGLKLSKELTRNGDDYDIRMESYSTANTTKTTVTEKVPTDFVIIVDQSRSMSTSDMPTDYEPVTGSKALEDIAAGQYYIKGDDGNYYRVYGVRNYLYEYFPSNSKWVRDVIEDAGYDLSWFQGEDEATFTKANQYYYYVNGTYRPVTVTAEGKLGAYYIRFKYQEYYGGPDIYFNRGDHPVYWNLLGGGKLSEGWIYDGANGFVNTFYPNREAYTYSTVDLGLIQPTTGMFINYPMYKRHVGYNELRYRDVNGVEHSVNPMSGPGTAEYCNSDGQAVTTLGGNTRMNYNKLYKAKSGATQTRLQALKYALGEFATAVANEKDTKTGEAGSVDNRVAIVGFSSSGYNNTEILTGENLTIRNNNGTQKADATATDYSEALVSGTDNGKMGVVNPKITAAIDAITANGGTQPEDGFAMAQQIFAQHSDETYTMQTVDGNPVVPRNKIVIFFTDGQPGNYDYSDQYKEANDVVKAAKLVKDQGAKVFSIGVFGESDGNPLLYPRDKNADGTPKSVEENNDNEYEDGYIDKVKDSGSYYYYMKRQWRNNADDAYGAEPNDTIFDYMSVTSSNYPSATGYCSDEWIAGTAPQGTTWLSDITAKRGAPADDGANNHYRMAANQDTLVAAFTQAVTHAGAINSHSSATVLDENAVFKDAVNTEDFDISDATYSVYKQKIHVNENVPEGQSMIETQGEPEELQGSRKVPESGEISYTGFDYAENYVAYGHPDGYKLIVKIEGLRPKTFGVTVNSNADQPSQEPEGEPTYACGIYEAGSEEPAISVKSPTLYALKLFSTYLADFGAPLIVATDVPNENGITEKAVTNGDFTRSEDGKAVYQLTSQALSGTTAVVNGAYTAVDSAKITGKHVSDGDKANVQPRTVNVIPASSVYYSDSLTTPVTIGDGIGYNAGFDNEASEGAQDISGVFYFTFYGTGIDAYCTTHKDAGYITAALYRGSGQSACVKDNREGKAKTIKNYSSENIYNTPSVSFTGLEAGTYTLKITANDGAYYKLDGVRVYDPVQANSDAEAELNKTEEADATYLNLRKVLLNDQGIGGFTVTNDINGDDIDPSTVSGVLFLDDVSHIVTQSNYDEDHVWHEEPVALYQSQFDVYKANGPKNEIYLDANQGLTFQMNVTKFDENTKVFLGLSAPKGGTGNVKINGKAVTPVVDSVMDMYYPVEVNLDNQDENHTLSITITNEGSNMIAITNLKITGVKGLIPAATNSNQAQVLNATRALFAPVTMKTVRMAANNGIDPEAETPAVTEEPTETEEPTVTEDPGSNGDLVIEEPEDPDTPTPEPAVTPTPKPDNTSAVQKVIQSVTKAISSFFKSIFRR